MEFWSDCSFVLYSAFWPDKRSLNELGGGGGGGEKWGPWHTPEEVRVVRRVINSCCAPERRRRWWLRWAVLQYLDIVRLKRFLKASFYSIIKTVHKILYHFCEELDTFQNELGNKTTLRENVHSSKPKPKIFEGQSELFQSEMNLKWKKVKVQTQ